jgi:membrane fusion protein, multidrug efflux system
VKLNDAEPRATLQRTTYRMELAELKERRLAKLLETSSVNQQDYDAGLSELSVLRAEVALVEAQLAKMEIRAPFDGVVGLRFVSEGAFVTPATRVATLQRFDRLKIDFSIPEKYAFRIRIGSLITFAVDGGGRHHSGEIYAIDPRIDAGTRTVLIRAICPNPDQRLLPGAFANVHFKLAEVTDALLVPATAVIPGLSEKNVFVVHEGKAVRRPVQIGVRTESSVQIIDGLAAGETVITSGIQQLRAGQAVKVTPIEPAVSAVKQITVEQNETDDAAKRSTPAS